jgi:hypothetical protein
MATLPHYCLGVALLVAGLASTAQAKDRLFSAETLERAATGLQEAARSRILARDGERMWNAIRLNVPLTDHAPGYPKHHALATLEGEYIRAGRYMDGKQLQLEYKGTNGEKRRVVNFGGSFGPNRYLEYSWNNGRRLSKLESPKGVKYLYTKGPGSYGRMVTAAEAGKILRQNGRIVRKTGASATYRAVQQTRRQLNKLVPRIIMTSRVVQRAIHGRHAKR